MGPHHCDRRNDRNDLRSWQRWYRPSFSSTLTVTSVSLSLSSSLVWNVTLARVRIGSGMSHILPDMSREGPNKSHEAKSRVKSMTRFLKVGLIQTFPSCYP